MTCHEELYRLTLTSFRIALPWQIRNQLVRAKVRFVASFPKFHYNDMTDLLPTCWRHLDMFAMSLTSPQQVGNFPIN